MSQPVASRQELTAWLNELLQLNYTRIEQCGTGAAVTQVFDSIWGDIHMARIKYNANSEYQYLENWKILQVAFKAHRVDKPILLDRLAKCRMQDNLEFLQWVKRYWDQYYPGGEYDAPARRKGALSTAHARAPAPASATPRAMHTPAKPANTSQIAGRRPASATPSAPQVSKLRTEIEGLREAVDGLEKERDFYFNKLRDIEIVVQATAEEHEAAGEEDAALKQIQAILYSTEEGFEIPEPEGGEGGDLTAETGNGTVDVLDDYDDLETF